MRGRLFAWLIAPLLLVNLAGAVLAYTLAWLPAQSAIDHGLGSLAGALARRVQLQDGQLVLALPPAARDILEADPQETLIFHVQTGDGRWLGGERALAWQGGGTRDLQWQGESLRLVERSLRVQGKELRIAVASTVRQRAQWRASIVRALLPLELLFTVAAVLIIGVSLRIGLRPLARVRSALHEREAGDFTPLDLPDLPRELAPVVQAFNELLEKAAGARADQHAFLANMAHQLRTPLAGIQLQLEVLRARHADDAESARALALIQTASERMIRQARQLLALARAEPDRFDASQLRPLDLASLLADTVQLAVEEAGRKQIDIGFHLAKAPLLGEAFLLRDLADNLIDNAIRYTPPGGHVTVVCGANAEGTWLRVEDNGPGIPAAMRQAVFSRHVRLDDKSSGTGLGLAIVRDIARAHAASVSIESGAGGGGSSVRVFFPPLLPNAA
nr:sensor histidine kinase [Massilia sp. TS11]